MGFHRYTYDSADQAAAACARQILLRLEEALSGHGKATVAVSGGSTPKLMFDHLAKTRFDWRDVHLFWVDERMAPPEDPESNYHLCEEHFIRPSHFPRRNVHRIRGELRPDVAAKNYVDDLRDFFGLDPGDVPHFDVIHLGIGSDAHTASLFPGEPLILDRNGVAAAVYVEKLTKWRVTLLPRTLLAAKHVVVLAAGNDKTEALKNVLEAPYDPMRYPAQIISHHCRHQTWFLDEAAVPA
jgi:6-phosphogluconolactonase